MVGVGQDGCGLESQLESVYRFLIQPDPWDQVLKFDIAGKADIGTGVDDGSSASAPTSLRPDSLVAVIMLTDEDDSSSDPLAVDGFGYTFMAQIFPGSDVTRGKGRGHDAAWHLGVRDGSNSEDWRVVRDPLRPQHGVVPEDQERP